jgi:hypothetical protein
MRTYDIRITVQITEDDYLESGGSQALMKHVSSSLNPQIIVKDVWLSQALGHISNDQDYYGG